MKHTQGEWVKGYGNGLTGPTTVISPGIAGGIGWEYIPISKNQETVAIVIMPENLSTNEMEANAKLIAAAPDMLYALKEISKAIDSSNMKGTVLHGIVRDAILKATS